MRRHLFLTIAAFALLATACTPAEFNSWHHAEYGVGVRNRTVRTMLAEEASLFWAEDCALLKYLDEGYDLRDLPTPAAVHGLGDQNNCQPLDSSVDEPAITAAPAVVESWIAANWAGPASQWPCFRFVVNEESGFDADVWNFAGSGAWGLGQFLRSTRASYGITTSSSVSEQVVAINRYMTDRYGSPCGAQTFWQGHHWY